MAAQGQEQTAAGQTASLQGKAGRTTLTAIHAKLHMLDPKENICVTA